MRLFLAGPGASRHILGPIIRDVLPAHGHESYDWTSGPGWDNPQAFDPREVARKDLEEVRLSDALIWYIDDTPSHGAPFEAGYAIASGIPVIYWFANGSRRCESLHNLIYVHLNRADGDIEYAFNLEEAIMRAEIAAEKAKSFRINSVQALQREANYWKAMALDGVDEGEAI